MAMRTVRYVLIFIPLLITCVSVRLRSDTPPVTNYALDIGKPDQSGRKLGGIIRIRPFDVAPEFDRKELIRISDQGIIRWDSSHQWAVRPAEALGELLYRDLVAEQSFDAIFSGPSALNEDVMIMGYLREFGIRRTDRWNAVIDFDLTIVKVAGREIVQKSERLEKPLASEGYLPAVTALRDLSGEWSAIMRAAIREGMGDSTE